MRKAYPLGLVCLSKGTFSPQTCVRYRLPVPASRQAEADRLHKFGLHLYYQCNLRLSRENPCLTALSINDEQTQTINLSLLLIE